jgi:hypothetical protein
MGSLNVAEHTGSEFSVRSRSLDVMGKTNLLCSQIPGVEGRRSIGCASQRIKSEIPAYFLTPAWDCHCYQSAGKLKG